MTDLAGECLAAGSHVHLCSDTGGPDCWTKCLELPTQTQQFEGQYFLDGSTIAALASLAHNHVRHNVKCEPRHAAETLWKLSTAVVQRRLCNAATLLITPNAFIPAASAASRLQMRTRSEFAPSGRSRSGRQVAAALSSLSPHADKPRKMHRGDS